MRLSDLENAYRVMTVEDPRVAPGGPMSEYAGDQLSAAAIAEAYLSGSDGLVLPPVWLPPLVRSFEVPSLVGVTGELHAAEAERHLRALLQAALPGVMIGRSDGAVGVWGPIEKYGTLDTSLYASRDEATGQQMSLEVGGHCLGPDGTHLRRVEGDRTVVRITRAHWTNVSGLRVGGPFYL